MKSCQEWLNGHHWSWEFWEIYKLDVIEIPTNRPIARKDRDDLIYKTKQKNTMRLSRIPLSNAGRPVLIGTTSVEISELLSKMLNIRKVYHNVLNANCTKKRLILWQKQENQELWPSLLIWRDGNRYQAFRCVKEGGGLAIIEQLPWLKTCGSSARGRSGRQGDPGSSQFCPWRTTSCVFGSDRVAKVMDRMGLKKVK